MDSPNPENGLVGAFAFLSASTIFVASLLRLPLES